MKKGVDPLAIEHQMWSLLDERGAEYPPERNLRAFISGQACTKKPLSKTGSEPIALMWGFGHTSKLKYWNKKQIKKLNYNKK